MTFNREAAPRVEQDGRTFGKVVDPFVVKVGHVRVGDDSAELGLFWSLNKFAHSLVRVNSRRDASFSDVVAVVTIVVAGCDCVFVVFARFFSVVGTFSKFPDMFRPILILA